MVMSIQCTIANFLEISILKISLCKWHNLHANNKLSHLWVKRECLGYCPYNWLFSDKLCYFSYRKFTTALYCPSLSMHTYAYLTAAKVSLVALQHKFMVLSVVYCYHNTHVIQ